MVHPTVRNFVRHFPKVGHGFFRKVSIRIVTSFGHEPINGKAYCGHGLLEFVFLHFTNPRRCVDLGQPGHH